MSATRTTADLAVVVIGLGAPAELVEAVRSVEAQDMAAEIVVVNSGGGDAAKLLSDAGIHVPVRETAERLYVGAARNLGIVMTAAPFVAFLASDCLAAPGWVAERVRLHKTGMRSVASAVLPAAPENRISWAHHLLLFPRRLPGLKASDALRYGASYDRRLFDEIGLFDDSLRTGEDTEFAARLSEAPAWEPRVVTLHRNALRIGDLLRDQYARGRRYYVAMNRLRGFRAKTLIRQVLGEPKRARSVIETALTGRDREIARASLPILRLGAFAKALGILAGATWSRDREAS